MNLRLGLAALLVAGAATGVYLWNPDQPAIDDTPVPPVQQSTPDAPPPRLAVDYTAPTAVRDPDAATRARMVRLPNGDFVPSLNGVINAPPMEWGDATPYSPIIGKERDSRGQEWYVHMDGSKSTTTNVYRSDLGRYDGSTQVAHPTPALPMEPNELEAMKRAGAGGGGTPAPKPGAAKPSSGVSSNSGGTAVKG